jgi:tetratricopeptide (TPR) repeat protein
MVYIGVRSKEVKLAKKLERLLQRERVFLVEIEGFDEFMAELHEFIGLELPIYVRDPYRATTEILNRFISEKEIDHPVIKKHVAALNDKMKTFEQAITGKTSGEELSHLIPYGLLVQTEFQQNGYNDVIKYADRAIAQNPENIEVMSNIIQSYINLGKIKKALELAEESIKKWSKHYWFYHLEALALSRSGKVKDAIKTLEEAVNLTKEDSFYSNAWYICTSNYYLMDGDWDSALNPTELGLELFSSPRDTPLICNKCAALKKLGKVEEAEKIIKEFLPKVEISYYRACFFATLEDKDNMLKELSKSFQEDVAERESAKFDPDFDYYREDPDFRKLVFEEK